jgi:16S rRNA C1402 (ribose-2'-O) methylase RsmI
VLRGTASELAERVAEPPKGEVTLVLGSREASDEERADVAAATAAVAELAAAGTPRGRAAEVVARLTGVPRNRLYRDSL